MKKYRVLIIAGEASGDNLGAKLIKALNENEKAEFEFAGLGCSKMIANGLNSCFPMKDISIMGFFEVLPRIPRVLLRIRQLVKFAKKFDPDIVITIDSYGFNTRFVKNLRKKFHKKIPYVHYVAPTVWAYKPERAKVIASLYDHQLLLLPFEKPYFDKARIESTFIGHPIIEDLDISQKISKDKDLVLVMPGSRIQEIKYHGKIFREAIRHSESLKNAKIFVPTLPNLEKMVRKIFHNDPRVIVSSDEKEKSEAKQKASYAIVKSGTSSLEMVLYDIPTVVAFKFSAISYQMIKNKLTIKFASLANLILNKMVIPEFIQKECKSSEIAKEFDDINYDKKRTAKMRTDFAKVRKAISCPDHKKNPSQMAAKVVINLLEKFS